MILTDQQAAIVAATFRDCRRAGVESISMIVPAGIIEWSLSGVVAMPTTVSLMGRRLPMEKFEMYRDEVELADAYGLSVIDVEYRDGRVRTFAASKGVTAAEFAERVMGPIVKIAVLR